MKWINKEMYTEKKATVIETEMKKKVSNIIEE